MQHICDTRSQIVTAMRFKRFGTADAPLHNVLVAAATETGVCVPMISPAELARVALRRIAELRLSPTPEHYEKFYYEAAGQVAKRVPAVDEQVVQRLHELVAKASSTTEHLASGLQSTNNDLSVSIQTLADAYDGGASRVLSEIVASTRQIRATVEASHAELLDTQHSLSAIKAELVESRKLLGQDPLTGTENRRAMSAVLEREIVRARREGEPLVVAMIDIDHFKKINDSLGHDAGDAALIHLTRVAKTMLRGNDCFVRYGGEEFVLVLPETGLQGGVQTAARLQALLTKKPFVYDGQVVVMTFSAGVALLKDDDAETSLLRRADAGLYQAKREGRNRIVAMP